MMDLEQIIKQNYTQQIKFYTIDNKPDADITFYISNQDDQYNYIKCEETQEILSIKNELIGATLYKKILNLDVKTVNIEMLIGNCKMRADIIYGLQVRSFCFDYFKTEKTKKIEVNCIIPSSCSCEKILKSYDNRLNSIILSRILSMLPSNVLYPTSYAELLKKIFIGSNIDIDIWNSNKILQNGMNMLHAVGKASIYDSRVVFLRKKNNNTKQTIYLIGKGVTFDSGGISIKGSSGMADMKYDMSGSAAVISTMLAIKDLDLNVNVVGIVGLVENMPGGNAYKPGDIIKSLSGKWVEINNTDAEGRLVLGDLISYATNEIIDNKSENSKIITIATLTGAVSIALGKEYAAIFSNLQDSELRNQLIKAGELTGDNLWYLPSGEKYKNYLTSPIADMQNATNKSITIPGSQFGAQFLIECLTKTNVDFCHLDIAGVVYNESNPKYSGYTGFGTELFINYLINNFN